MSQATQPAPVTAPTSIRTHTAQRSAYKRASALAGRIVDRLTVLPHDVEARGDRGAYGLRLHFGTGLDAGRGVLEVARIADVEVIRDQAEHAAGAWVECHGSVEGIPLIARALLTPDDADQLLDAGAPAPVPVITLVKAPGGAR